MWFALVAGGPLSAVLIERMRTRRAGRADGSGPPHLREGFAALRPRPVLAAATVVFAVAVTSSSGTWIGGVPQLVRATLGRRGELLGRDGRRRGRLDRG